MKYVLEIADIVYRDIVDIQKYVSKDNPSAGKKLAVRLFDSIEQLATTPVVGFDLKKKFGIDTELKASIVKPYLIIFELVDNKVIVYRIIDGRRDYFSVLGLNEFGKEFD